MSSKKHQVKEKKQFTPRKLEKLKFIIIVVTKGHGVAINDLLLENGASMTSTLYAEGTKEKYVMDILGGEDKDKECVLAVVNEKAYEKIKERLDIRFTISQAAKGLLLAFDLSSMAGVLAYKFISDYEGGKKYGNKK